MNGDVGELATLTGVSVAVNAVYAIQHGKNAVVTVVAGGFLFVSLALVGGVTGRYDIARALAAVFLLSSVLLHGIPLVDAATAASKNAHTTKPSDAKPVSAAVVQPNFVPPHGVMVPQ